MQTKVKKNYSFYLRVIIITENKQQFLFSCTAIVVLVLLLILTSKIIVMYQMRGFPLKYSFNLS